MELEIPSDNWILTTIMISTNNAKNMHKFAPPRKDHISTIYGTTDWLLTNGRYYNMHAINIPIDDLI